MGRTKLGLIILVAATIALGSQQALAIMIPEAARGGVKWVDLESIRGRVTAVNPSTDTLVVASKGKDVTAADSRLAVLVARDRIARRLGRCSSEHLSSDRAAPA